MVCLTFLRKYSAAEFLQPNPTGVPFTKRLKTPLQLKTQAAAGKWHHLYKVLSVKLYFQQAMREPHHVSEIFYCVTWGNGVLEIVIWLHFFGCMDNRNCTTAIFQPIT